MLAALADIRPEERRGATGAFLTLFGILAGHTILETARDALFLARLPPSQLPWVYLAIAGVAVGLSQGPSLVPRRLTSRYSLSMLLVAAGSVTSVFWLLGTWTNPWALRALYTWTGLVGTLTGLQFWLVLSELYTVTQAKRVYRLVGAGSLMGAVVGAGLARVVTSVTGPDRLILLAAAVFLVTGLGPALLMQRPEADMPGSALGRGRPSLVQAFDVLRRNPYIQGLGGLTLVSTVALTLADYVFKSTVVRNVPAAELGRFFAAFYMVLNLLALSAQLVLMGWVLRVLGLHRALRVLPIALFVGAGGLVFGGGLVAALLLKGADGTLRPSLHRTTTELLFVPIPDALRSRAKPFIDVVGQRGGQALASLVILAELELQRGDAVLAGLSAALSLIWIAWAADLKGHYLDLFRAALREGALQDRVDLPPLDLGSLETLFAALNSQDDAEVTGALDLLAAEGRTRLIPALVLYHPSRQVVLKALGLFERSGRRDFVPIADRLLASEDSEVRAAALRARTAASPDEQVLRRASDDPSPLVRATALAGLVYGGWISDDAQRTLDELLQSGSVEAKAALAHAIRRQPAAVFVDVLLQLGGAPQVEVQVQAAHAMGAVKSQVFFPSLLSMLASRHTRAAARAAFLAHGDDALEFLDVCLYDRALPHEMRRHVPRTISLFAPAAAARTLQNHLLSETDGMVRFKIIRGLGRIAADHPEVSLDERVLREAAERTLEAAFRLVHWRLILARGAAEDPRRATPGHELLVTLLRDKEIHAQERLFRLLALQNRGEDFRQMYRGLRNSSAKVRASSRELLENLLQPPLRGAVLALVDDAPDERRLAGAQPYFATRALGYEELLVSLLEQSGETLRSLAAYHVGELGLTTFRERLQALDPRQTGFFAARVIERALRLLSRPPELLGAH